VYVLYAAHRLQDSPVGIISGSAVAVVLCMLIVIIMVIIFLRRSVYNCRYRLLPSSLLQIAAVGHEHIIKMSDGDKSVSSLKFVCHCHTGISDRATRNIPVTLTLFITILVRDKNVFSFVINNEYKHIFSGKMLLAPFTVYLTCFLCSTKLVMFVQNVYISA